MRFVTLSFLLLLLHTGSKAQQAWTLEKGKYYAQLGFSYLSYNSLLNGSRDNIDLGRSVSDATLQVYGEYGLSKHITLSGVVPLKLLSVKNDMSNNLEEGSLTALSNTQVGATISLWRKHGWVISGKLNAAFQTVKFDVATGLRTGFQGNTVTPSFMAGYGHAKFFSSAELGYTMRTNNLSNRYIAAWQIGKHIGKKKKWMGILGLEYAESDGKGTFFDGTASTTGLYLDEQSYLSPNLRLGYFPNAKFSVWLSAGGAVGTVARAVAATPGLSISVGYKN
jgi:hypothetical protein